MGATEDHPDSSRRWGTVKWLMAISLTVALAVGAQKFLDWTDRVSGRAAANDSAVGELRQLIERERLARVDDVAGLRGVWAEEMVDAAARLDALEVPAVLPDTVAMRRAAVRIVWTAASGRPIAGSGVIIGPRTVLTNRHVVSAGNNYSVHLLGVDEPLPATLRWRMSNPDIAVLDVEIPSEFQPVSVNCEPLKVEEIVYAVGSPVQTRWLISRGTVLSDIPFTDVDGDVWPVGVVMSYGSSGGPVYGPDGRLRGLVTAFQSMNTPLGFPAGPSIPLMTATADICPLLHAAAGAGS